MARSRRSRRSQHASRRRSRPQATNADDLRQCHTWLLGGESIFASIRLHGNIKWTASLLVWLALAWSWSEARCLTDAFSEALACCHTVWGCTPIRTYQGFLGALTTWTPQLLPVLWSVLQQRMQQIGGKFWHCDGWVPIAFDGSRSTAPRSRDNEKALCAPNYGQGTTAKYRAKKSKGMRRRKNQAQPSQPQEPQAWITLLWHMRLRLPWCWRLGPSNASEREHVMDMIQTGRFPSRTLFCGDAGFVGYPLWSCIREAGADFLVRVGANVHLLHEQAQCQFTKKGKQRLVLCWPKTALAQQLPPLRLRLVQVQIGRTKMWLLTSVLERAELSAAAMVRLYQMRWGVEVEFRGLKQTLERSKLRCRNSARLMTELTWSLAAMAVAELLALKEQLASRTQRRPRSGPQRAYEPSQRSLANTLRALRGCLRAVAEVPAAGNDLASRLGKAVTDGYQRRRSKKARYRRPNPDKKPLGDPKIRPLDEKERRRLELLAQENTA